MDAPDAFQGAMVANAFLMDWVMARKSERSPTDQAAPTPVQVLGAGAGVTHAPSACPGPTPQGGDHGET
eukprot:5176412-Prorocentrum_lima.AAC.1